MAADPIDLKSFEKKTAQEIVAWGLKEFHPRLALASSFGVEDVVLIDLMAKIEPKARVFTLDTGRLPQETYDLMDKIRDKYKIKIETYFPDAAAVEKMVNEKGYNLFYQSIENRKECCGIRKVEPLKRALKGLKAWVTGLRREQSVTRTSVAKIEIDNTHGGIYKINPLADWTREQVWDYIKKNGVPYNKLHDKGYLSIGCDPCTRAVKSGEDERSGRWWWERPDQKECGIHRRSS